MASQRISVRVSREIAQRLKERSHATGARESDVVRKALENYLPNNGKEQPRISVRTNVTSKVSGS